MVSAAGAVSQEGVRERPVACAGWMLGDTMVAEEEEWEKREPDARRPRMGSSGIFDKLGGTLIRVDLRRCAPVPPAM